MNRLDGFISQLDGLVVFLAASHQEVFQTIREHKLTWFPESQNPRLLKTFKSYGATVNNAAFLLGYAHFEAFLADLARDIFLQRPALLPQEKQVTVKEVLGAKSRGDILRLMIDREIRNVFYGKIESVRDYYQNRFQISWPNRPQIVVASRMRNCLMHNGARVDERLAEVCERAVGSRICLASEEVNEFGIMGRTFAREIWDEANRRHLKGAG